MRRLSSMAVGSLLAATLAAGATAADDPRAERFELPNGLDVILRPIEGEGPVALLVLYDVGEDHDPAGRSGLGHLIEHLYVTAAAGAMPATTAEEWFARYESQANAQTGRRYTTFAAVFASDQLDQELLDAAARMTALKIEAADIAREIPRIQAELANMFGGMPALAAGNIAAGAASPMAEGARKGGVMEQIAAVTPAEVSARLESLYKPTNARLILAGAFDPAVVRPRVEALFGPIPRGEPVPAPRAAAPPRIGATETVNVPRPAFGEFPAGLAAVAWRVPEPGHPDYAAFLVMFGRLFARVDLSAPTAMRQVDYMPLDRPDVLILGTGLDSTDQAESAFAFLRGQAAAAATLQEGETITAGYFIERFGPFMGFADFPDFQIAAFPYSVGFMLGRRAQLGIDPARLQDDLAKVTADDLRRMDETWFGPGQGASVVMKIGGEPAP